MPDLQPFQKMLWAKARAAGVTLPKDSETAGLTKPEIDRLVAGIERGEDVFGSAGRPEGSGSTKKAPWDRQESTSDLVSVLERIADAMEAIAAREPRR